MKAVFAVASIFACALLLDAQITATQNRLADGHTEIKVRNNSSVSLDAFAVSIKYTTPDSAGNAPVVIYVDTVIDAFPAIGISANELPPRPIVAGAEYTTVPLLRIAKNGNIGEIHFEEPIITAGIFAGGATTGDAILLNRLMLRRSNMLLAVETILEMLSDAGRRNIPRDQLLRQLRTMSDSVNRWYVPPEQQVGRGLYQSVIGKLMSLPEEPAGSPFPPSAFVARETAALNRQRVILSESQPSLAEIASIGR